MSESAQTTGIRDRGGLAVPAALAGRRFLLAVGAVTLAAGAFLLHQLLAWPPHEDETLALFVGRYPLDQLFQVVLEERGGAPLHFLLAWAIAHLGLGLEGLRLSPPPSRSPASRSSPLSARGWPAGGRRLSRRCSWRRAGRSSSTASTDGCTASSSLRAPSRTWRSCAPSSGGIVAPGHSGRWRSSQPSRRTRTGRSC